MYYTQSIPELRQMADESECSINFNMKTFFDNYSKDFCGTSGCHIGTFIINRRGKDRLKYNICTGNFSFDGKYYTEKLSDGREIPSISIPISMRFGIGVKVTDFLFCNHGVTDNGTIGRENNYSSYFSSQDAQFLCKDKAVARLRKYCDYIESQRRKWDNYYWQQSLPKKLRKFAKLDLVGCKS